MSKMTSTKSRLVSVEGAVDGSVYQGAHGIFPKDPPPLVMWRKDPEAKTAYAHLPNIDTIVALPYSYWIEESSQIDIPEYGDFDRRMRMKFNKDFPNKPSFWLKKPVITPSIKKDVKTDNKETTIMAEVPTAAPTKTLSKKEIRATYNAEIKTWKEQRETLSTANVELKKKVAATESREERKGFNDQIKANVDKRAQLSDAIKANVEKVKGLRAA